MMLQYAGVVTAVAELEAFVDDLRRNVQILDGKNIIYEAKVVEPPNAKPTVSERIDTVAYVIMNLSVRVWEVAAQLGRIPIIPEAAGGEQVAPDSAPSSVATAQKPGIS